MNKVSELSGIFSLSFLSDVQLASFDCGKLSLNAWLAQKARGNKISGGSRTYVLLTTEAEIAGFYTLSNYCIEPSRSTIGRCRFHSQTLGV